MTNSCDSVTVSPSPCFLQPYTVSETLDQGPDTNLEGSTKSW